MANSENGNSKKFDPSVLFRATSNAQYCWSLLWPTLRQGKAVTMQQLTEAWEKVNAGFNATGKPLPNKGNTQSASAKANEYRNWCVRTGTWARSQDCPGYVLGPRFDGIKTKASKPASKRKPASKPASQDSQGQDSQGQGQSQDSQDSQS